MTQRILAIDGPAASGKSTVARRAAEALGWTYVDSGALYRVVTWRALRLKIAPENGNLFEHFLDGLQPDFFVSSGVARFKIEGIEDGRELRTHIVNENVSKFAALPEVRSRVVAWLRGMTRFGDLVMEGRDIGTVVFPDAGFKFYLDASPDERARRRHAEMAGKADLARLGEVGESLKRRDAIDSSRQTDPLKTASDAIVIDTTSLSIEEVTQLILKRVASRGLPRGRRNPHPEHWMTKEGI